MLDPSDLSSGDATRLRIVEAAGPIFAEQGYQAATVREICSAAQVNLAAINYYFGDKQRLYLDVVRFAQQRNAAAALSDISEVGLDDPALALHRFIDVMLNRMLSPLRDSWEGRLMMREVLQPTEACKQLVEEYFRPQFDRLVGIVNRLVPAPTSQQDLRRIAFSIVGQCFYYRVAGGVVELIVGSEEKRANFHVNALVEHIYAFSLGAIRSCGNRANVHSMQPSSLNDP